jgi:hypothetical protein
VPGVVAEAYEGMDAIITQGFVGVTADGEPTVLGRGGSDYSASLIGMAVDAEKIEIWTDVDGVRTADPRYVPNTKSLEKISFEEAAEMAHFGAKVLHPLTIEPAVKKNIPIYVLNSMNPSGKGTAILRNELIEDGVKSVSFKENIKVINIFSTKMINTSGFLRRVFEIFSESKVSVDLISTSEANISVTVDAAQNVEVVDSHCGDEFEIDGVHFKILSEKNPEMLTHYNDQSMVIRVWDDHKSVVFLGDLGPEGGRKLMNSEYMKDVDCDYLQMAHHGQAGCDKEFYQRASFRACLWPTPTWVYNNDLGQGFNTGHLKTIEVREWMKEKGIAEHYVSCEGLVRIK